MRIEVDELPPPAAWDGRVAALRGTLFQSHAWAAYRCHDGRARALHFSWFDDRSDDPVAVALGIEHPAPGRMEASLGTRLTFDGPPAALTPGRDFAGSLERWCAGSRSVVELNLGSFDARTRWSDHPLASPLDRIEFHLLPREEDEAFRHMRKGARWSIKKARKAGVEVEPRQDASALGAFAELYRSTLDRLERTKGVPAQPLAGDRFAAALELLVKRGNGRLYLATLAGQPVAGCFFGLFDDGAFYLFNGSTDKALAVGATPLALHQAARDLAGAGISRINLGGVGAGAADPGSTEHGLYSFKLGLGATPVPCLGGRVKVKPLRAGLVAAAARLQRRARAVLS